MPVSANRTPSAQLTLVAVALLVIAPLLRHGSSCGHDFDFHLLSWLEIAAQYRHGVFHPVWAFTPAWNAGEPRFIFYPPLSWTVGALLTLSADAIARLLHLSRSSAFATVPVTFTFFAVLAGGLALYRVARARAAETAALLGAALYMCSPYALFTAYERTAYAEMLSLPIFPLLLNELLESPTSDASRPVRSFSGNATPSAVLRLGLLVALLWLSNAPAAIMGCYLLLAVAVVRIALLAASGQPWQLWLSLAGRYVAGTVLGFALSAFFLLPALAERPWVQLRMASIAGMRPGDNTLFHHTGDPEHDLVLHTASVVAVGMTGLLLAAIATAAVRWRRYRLHAATGRAHMAGALQDRAQPSPPLPFTFGRGPLLLVLLSLLLLLLLTPLALPLWHGVPDLAVLQFPWRLLAPLSACVALLWACALQQLRIRGALRTLLVLFAAAACVTAAYSAFRQTCDAEDTPKARADRFALPNGQARGSEPTDEYTPVAADNDVLADNNAEFWLLGSNDSNDADAPANPPRGSAPQHLTLHLEHPARLVFNLRDYPGWHVTRNGLPLTMRIARNDGLLAVSLPAGDADIRIAWQTTRADRAGQAISVAGMLAATLLWWRSRKRPDPALRRAGQVSSSPDG